jgi:phage terminase large subunit
MSNLDQLAQAAYSAMIRPTPAVELANALLTATTSVERGRLLDQANATVRDAALRYLAEPEATRERTRRLEWMRADKRRVSALKHYFRHHVADFICEYGTTCDPRLISDGKNPLVPFVLFPKQRELVQFIVDRITGKQHGLVAKGRDVGATATSVATLLSLCMLEGRFATGVGSSTEDKIDRSGVPDTIFAHADNFLAGVPVEFKGEVTRLYMRTNFGNGSSFVGEAGNQCGRGGRKAAYLSDEFAFHPFPAAVDAALSQNTNTVLWVSTFNGPAGPFYDKSLNKAIPRFDIKWSDRPDRDQKWYDEVKSRTDPVIFAQEVDANPLASREGGIIPAEWIHAAVGLHTKLGIEPTGKWFAGLDVADAGRDSNSLSIRHGILLVDVRTWSGNNSDLHFTTQRAFDVIDDHGLPELGPQGFDGLSVDFDGIGSGCKGAARVINDQRKEQERPVIQVRGYRGSEAPVHPERRVAGTDRKWQDFAANRKAQSWWSLRLRFEQSYRAANGMPYDPDEIISINPDIKDLSRLIAQLSQATATQNSVGKLVVDKLGEAERSPDAGDSTVISFAPRVAPVIVTQAHLERMGASTDWRERYRAM